MTQLANYNPIWPETVLFWGAGATQPLNMHTTSELGRAVYRLGTRLLPLAERVGQEFTLEWLQQSVCDLLSILGDSDKGMQFFPNSNQEQALARQFDYLSADRRVAHGRQLRYLYDWGTLRQLIQVCPGHDERSFRLQDVFNLLDMHIESRHGFYVYCEEENTRRFVAPESLVPARNALVMLIGLLHFHDYQKTVAGNPEVLRQYGGFADILAELMQEEGECFYRQGHELNKRRFYLFSYAVIHMNWDAILVWLLFNAHRKINMSGGKDGGIHCELFHDFNHFMGIRMIEAGNPDVWYPFNESVVQRVNNGNSYSAVRLGKFYFPHGCSGWRECPNCGKVTMYLGDEWQLDSISLFPPQLLPRLSNWRSFRSAEETSAYRQGQADAVQCAYCGTLTELRHTPLVMQSNFKAKHPPYLEEIQHDMRIALENAKHVVFMGYTLPADDVIYRSLLAARQKRGPGRSPYCSVIVGQHENAPDKWLYGRELSEFLHVIKKENPAASFLTAVEAARQIFDPEKVRGYALGIPAVFTDQSGNACREKIKELLYPKACFSQSFRQQ